MTVTPAPMILTSAVTAHIAAHAPTHVTVINVDSLGHPAPTTATTRHTPHPLSAIPHHSRVPPKS
jgi:hypothetical protein